MTKGAIAPFLWLAAAAMLLPAFAPGAARAEPAGPIAATLPAPGTYVLQRIQRVPQAQLLDENGARTRLSSLTQGAVTALGFFYGHCADPTGCPVAWSTFEAARRDASADALLKSRLRLVFVSLDPTHDTPAALRVLRDAVAAPEAAVPWAFLTSRSPDDLAPLLRDMGQDVSEETDAAGRPTGVINHMLKVFLIDPQGWVREIYTTAFLTPDNLLNDARTLAMTHEEADNRREAP